MYSWQKEDETRKFISPRQKSAHKRIGINEPFGSAMPIKY